MLHCGSAARQDPRGHDTMRYIAASLAIGEMRGVVVSAAGLQRHLACSISVAPWSSPVVGDLSFAAVPRPRAAVPPVAVVTDLVVCGSGVVGFVQLSSACSNGRGSPWVAVVWAATHTGQGGRVHG